GQGACPAGSAKTSHVCRFRLVLPAIAASFPNRTAPKGADPSEPVARLGSSGTPLAWECFSTHGASMTKIVTDPSVPEALIVQIDAQGHALQVSIARER